MCRGFLAIGGDGGVLEAPLLPHAAALNSACRIEPQVPPTAKRAKHVVRRRYPSLRALSGCISESHFFVDTHVNSATITPLDKSFPKCIIFEVFRCVATS